MTITKDLFDQQRRPRFGNANPERMQLAFWEWMIRGEDTSASPDDDNSFADIGQMMRDGKLKSVYGPYRARDLFHIPPNRDDGPIWTFDRMGRSTTELPDGRLIHVGGEHEDFYDPDFCIYNDVVVFGPPGASESDESIEIYGYPKEIFPPTDFHTATLDAHRIVIVGCLGYKSARRPGFTPVYALDTADYAISPLPTTGEMPGWISKHLASVDTPGVITVRGGEIANAGNGKHHFRRNVEDYALNLASGLWTRLTNRNWLQFSIRLKGGQHLPLDGRPKPASLVPRNATPMPCEQYRGARFAFQGVPVSLAVHLWSIDIICEGDLPERQAFEMAEEIRLKTEAALKDSCVLEQI